MKSNATYVGAWLMAAALTLVMAAHSPHDTLVMGRMPAFMTQTLMQQPVAVPGGLPADRTLAVITFERSQRPAADSWVEGLGLRHNPSIAWVRMPVIADPGSETGRQAFEARLRQHYVADAERARLVPVFTDRAHFVRAAGLGGTEKAHVVVVNRDGEVLARASGPFDADKAQNLRETLQGHSL
ncbi:hypothetical protein [Polaromonas sp. YR568]|uniref:hypothetical protein n=1 Tax=Polaromonas sp. YR568 TaxID=1855301 RepID=UPI003138354A